jgi:hypothetical protein
MRTASESYYGYQIQVVQHTQSVWQAHIYPETTQARPLNPALPTIRCATKEEAFTEARKRIFAKLKHLMRNAQSRDLETTWRKVGHLLDLFSPTECANYLVNAGYDSV